MQIWNGSKSLGEAFGDIGALIGSVFGGIYEWIAGALSGVGGAANDALQGLWDAFRGQLGGLGQWLWTTLNDLPRIITEALSNLGNMVIPGGGLVAGIMAIFAPLPMMILGVFNRLFPSVLPALMGFVNGIVSWFGSIGGRVAQTIMNLPQIVAMYFMLFIQSLQMRLNQARAIAGMLASMIRQAIVSRISTIVMRVRMVFMRVVQAIRMRLNQARAIAGSLAGMIRQAIVSRLNALVGRVRALFTRVVSTVRSRLANAVNAAREKAQEIVTNIVNKVQEVPQKVADEFNKVADRVRSALANAAAAAAAGARDIVNRFLSGLGVASPGIAQRTAAWEFGSIPGIIADSGVRAIKATKDMATGISSMWLRNKPSLDLMTEGMSMEEFNSIPRLPFPDMTQGMNILGQNIANQNTSTGITGQGVQRVTNNNNSTRDDHTINYHIERITLECSELTQEQSRRVLYNALDGLYGRGT
jgi:Flp pilus assembly pilin Flp